MFAISYFYLPFHKKYERMHIAKNNQQYIIEGGGGIKINKDQKYRMGQNGCLKFHNFDH
jgi:hypothetical protein